MKSRAFPLSRRFVSASLAIAIAWPVGRTIPFLVPKQSDPEGSLQHLLLSIFRSHCSVCAIGRVCLNTLPQEEKTVQEILNKIFADALSETEPVKSADAMRRRIASQVRRDFASGAIVDVDGWLLSITEARVYALISLSSEKA